MLRQLRSSALAGALLLGCSDTPLQTEGAAAAEKENGAGSRSWWPGPSRPDYEVWVVDQSNSFGASHGGTLYIYPGATLASSAATVAAERIDLAGATTARCLTSTGAAPVRPHMVFFNRTGSHAVLSFVASGHVVVFDARTREPVACLISSAGAGGARQAHAAYPAPDDSYILVANQNGKLLERIDADFGANVFEFDHAARLDLASCTTPSGAPCEAPDLRPDNAPICPIVDDESRLAFVTLRGGGLLVVNARQTPMRIVAEYDRTVVHGNGCGGIQVGRRMFLDSGGGTGANMTEFDVYRFELRRFRATNPVNGPAPSILYSDDHGHRDAHGMTVTGDERYLWVADRAANVIEVFDARWGRRLDVVSLVGSLSDDPTPDLLDVSPRGDLLFVTLRGPTPLSGDPHVSTGSTPGLGVLRLRGNGRTGELVAVHRITNPDAGGVERADPHGVRVRRIGRK
jgi:DNA-binding beta-propeller fold protein YncE